MKPTPGIIVAGSLNLAKTTAIVDWHWRQIGAAEFETKAGRRVIYAGDNGQSLRGRVHGTIIFRGYEWEKRGDAKVIEKMIKDEIFIDGDPTEQGESQ